jgi:hypothetical protein
MFLFCSFVKTIIIVSRVSRWPRLEKSEYCQGQNRDPSMRLPFTLPVLFLTLNGVALAHANVSDPTVKAWMDNMKAISAQTKILGNMAKRQTPFDAARANTALTQLAKYSTEVPALFKSEASDPVS